MSVRERLVREGAVICVTVKLGKAWGKPGPLKISVEMIFKA